MGHRNPNAKPISKPKTGNERRGNKDAQSQARQNGSSIIIKPIADTIKSIQKSGRSTPTPTVNLNLPKNQVTNRGNELIRSLGKPQLDKDRVKQYQYEYQSKGNKAVPFFSKLFKGFHNAKPYQFQFDPHKQEIKDKETWEHLNDEEFNSTPERQGLLKTLQNYSSSSAVVDYATKNLQHTDYWFTATDFFGDAVLGQSTKASHPANHFPNYLQDYLGMNVEIKTQEDYDMYLNRFKTYQNWIKEYTHSERSYDPSRESSDGFRDPFGATTTVDVNAPLPPWVEATPENIERWETYLHRSNQELQTINTYGEHYHEMLKQQGLDAVALAEKNLPGKVGSAASEFDQEGKINSFADIAYASAGRLRDGKSLASVTGSYFKDTKDYLRDYWVNPIRAGRWGTFFANRLFGAMDLLDTLPKGARALVASNPHILYDGNKLFDDQEAFVYSGGKQRQKLIMDAGGAELLNAMGSLSHGYNPNTPDTQKLRQQLKERNLLDDFDTLYAEYQKYKPEKSAFDNLLDAYTTPGKDFYVNSGNLGKDIALDVLLDPTLIIGGGAKSVTKGITKNIARASVEKGLNEAIGTANVYSRVLGRDEQRAVEGFIRSMDSRTVLFRNQKEIDTQVDALAERLSGVHILSRMNVDQFKNVVKTSIHDHVSTTNAAIVANSKTGINKAQEALLKSVDNIGWAADKIDSTLLKLAFPEPFMIKGVINSSKYLSDNTGVGKMLSTFYYRRRQKRIDDVRRAFGDDYRGVASLNLDQIEHFRNMESGAVNFDTSTEMRCAGATRSKIKSMADNCNYMLHRLRKGTISPEEALLNIRAELQAFAGKEICESLDDLDVIVKNRFDGYLDDSYEYFKLKYKEVEDFIQIRRSNFEKQFLEELRTVDDADKLFELLKKYHDHLDFTDQDLLKSISLKYNKSLISSEQLYDALIEIQSLPKNVFSANSGGLTEEAVVRAVQDSAEVSPLDNLSVLDGNTTNSVSDLTKMLSEPFYVKLYNVIFDETSDIKGFDRLRQIVFNNTADFELETKELLDIINHTFYDVNFAYGFKLSSDVLGLLDLLREFRAGIEQKVLKYEIENQQAVYRYQLDRMAVFDELINDPRIINFFDKFDNDIRPLLTGLKDGNLSSIDSVNHLGFYNILNELTRRIDAAKLFYTLDSKLSEIVNPFQKYALLDYLFGLSNKNNEKLLNQLTNDNSSLMHGLDVAIYSSYGENKIGIKNARVRMASMDSDIWGKYGDELRRDPELQKWVRNMVNRSAADPMSYINLQIMQSILLDPDAIKYYNEVNKYNPVVFTHFSTSGLNPANSAITGIGFKQWKELPENASLRDIFEHIINQDDEALRVAMPEEYFDNISEEFLNHIFDSHLALSHATYDDKLRAYKALFGSEGAGAIKTEADIFEEFCQKLDDLSYVTEGKKKVKGGLPCIVVHDFEGFNMPFFKMKVGEYSDSLGVHEVAKSLNDYERLSDNSFDHLKRIVNDHTLTSEEKEQVIRVLYQTIGDMNELGKLFRFLDLQDMSSQVRALNEYVNKGLLNNTNDPVLKQLHNYFLSEDSIAQNLDGLYAALQNIKDYDNALGDFVLYRHSTSPRVGSGLSPLNAAYFWQNNISECFESIDRLCEMCGITALARQYNSSYSYGGHEGPSHINISPDDLPPGIDYLPGYYADPAEAFLHEFGHYLFSKDYRFVNTVNSNIKDKIPPEFYSIEQDYIHPGVSDWLAREEMFVQGLALYLQKTDFIEELKSFYPDDVQYHSLLDEYSKIAKYDAFANNLRYNNTSAQAKEIEEAQSKFMEVTGLNTSDEFKKSLADALYSSIYDIDSGWKSYLRNALETKINPIRNSRGDDSLQYLLNMKCKYDMTNINSYFDFNKLSEPNLSLASLEKMSDLANYVIDNKYFILKTAEEFLTPYKANLDNLIFALREFVLYANSNSTQISSLDYILSLKSPKSAVESYLIVQKLYDDILKMYDEDLIKTFTATTFDRGNFDEYLMMRFVDGYSNPMQDEGINHAMSIPGIKDLLTGKMDKEIWMYPSATVDDSVSIYYDSSAKKLLDKVEKANRMKEVFRSVKRKIQSIKTLDDLFIAKGIIDKKAHKEAMLYQHVADFMNSVENKLDVPAFREALDNIQAWRRNYSQFYSLRKFLTDGVFDQKKIINELLWNDCGSIVIYPNKYTTDLEDGFKNFVEAIDEPYIGTSYEGGAYIVYIKKGYDIQENTKEGYRYLKGYETMRSTRNSYDAIPFPKYEEIATDSLTIEEYEQLKLIYKDIDYFSDGVSIGTLGNKLSMNQLTDFYKKIPDTYSKMVTPNALLQQDMYKSLVCDPGFISTESDIFTDILRAFENLERTTGDVKLAANFIFGEHSDTKMKDILSEVSNKEALDYLKQTDDYAIVQITSGDTYSGMFLQELKPKTEADIERLRDSDAVIIPFELYTELQARMNYKEVNSAMAVFNKALVAFKACQLCKPGAWIRNYVDATLKAILAEDEGAIAGAMQMVSREHKANKEVAAVLLMQQREPSYISERTWDDLRRRYKIPDMTWEDYQLLNGLLDRDNIVNTPVHAAHLREGIVSGKNVNFNDLSDADIKKIWVNRKLSRDPSVGMDLDTFNAIRRGDLIPSDAVQKNYDEVYRKVLMGFADREEPLFDKAVNAVFTPFNLSEKTARYAQMLWLRDLGYTYNRAVKRVADTQFRTLPNAHLLNKMEMIVPFATFKYNNALFWMRMIDKRPEYFKLFEHIYGKVAYSNYNQMMDEYGEYDVSNDYMLATGGIPIGGSGLYFKLDPSCLDFFRIFYGGLPDNIKGLNPLLQFGFKYSMYELGYSGKEFLNELDYEYSIKAFIEDTSKIIPGLNRLYDGYAHFHDKSYLYENAPNFLASTLIKFFPSIFGSQLDFESRSYSDFMQYQAELAKQGLWFDCNTGRRRPLSEKNELGANDPRLNWDDVCYYMMIHFGKAWDSNVGSFVPLDEVTKGGLNQEFDFDNDPDAWDKLCAEYKKVGIVYDYNIGKFVTKDKLTSGGLNDPNIDFKERTRLYKEKFGLNWDANQNKYVDSNHYIPGGLNDIDGIHGYAEWNKLKAYRRALYGEEYVKFDHPDENGRKGEFVKKHEPTCVTIESLLLKSARDNDYYQYVAVPAMASTDIKNCTVKDGFIRTKDGKYVLMWNKDYNDKVLGLFNVGSGFRKKSWKHFSHKKYQKSSLRRIYDPKEYKGIYVGHDYDDFYRYSYSYSGHMYRAISNRVVHRSNSGALMPYGGQYNKFSFYTR